MEFNFDTGRIYGGIQSIDTSILPPLGGTAGVLTIEGYGALRLPTGATSQQPTTPARGMIRFNTDKLALEVYDGTTWAATAGTGSVTYVQISTSGTGISVSGGPITTSGTFSITLNSVLQGLASLTNLGGFVVQTSPGIFSDRTITGTSGEVIVSNGDGLLGNPAIGLSTAGTPTSNSFSKITTDTYGRVSSVSPVTPSDISTLVDSIYLNATGDNISGNLLFTDGATATGLPPPVNGSDAVTKTYADSLIQGLSFKQAARAATTGNITLSGTQVVDGVSLSKDDRVLVKDQNSQIDNGIYAVSNSTWKRTSDANTNSELSGAYLFITEGSMNIDTSWAQVTVAPVIGTDNILWIQFSGAGTYTAGAGLTLSGTQFSLSLPVATFHGGTGALVAPTAGELLIGNSSGSYVPALLGNGQGISINSTSGNISISNTGVLSFNNRTGIITLNSTDVISALGYTPVSKLGDTISGSLGVSGTISANSGSSISLTGGQNPTDPSVIAVTSTAADASLNIVTQGSGVVSVNGAQVLTTSSNYVSKITAGSNIVISPSNGLGEVQITSTGGIVDITGGTGISVSNVSGSVVITNTGVTSVGLVDGSSSPIFNITSSPVTTSGTITQSLVPQVAKTLLMGPATGTAQPSFRSLQYSDLPFVLYAENADINVVTQASGENSSAFGDGAVASIYGSKVFANGSFATPGDAQSGLYVLRNVLDTGSVGELFLDGISKQLIFPVDGVVVFEITVSARRTDAVGGGAGYKFVGVYRKDSTGSSATFVGMPSKTILGETDVPWDANVSINSSTGALVIGVIGEAGKTIRWVATVQTTEVYN